MTVLDKPQILTHCSSSLAWTPYDVQWIPSTAKIVVVGQTPRGMGMLQVMELDVSSGLKTVKTKEVPKAIKCATMGAASLQQKLMATGDFDGNLSLFSLENLDKPPVWSTKAHAELINCIDAAGGIGVNNGPPEVVTGSRDGTVKVWDTRQKDRPVATIAPAENEQARDVWAVAFGNSFNDAERCLCAGYDNGDLKMFDMKNMSLLWETNVKNGICSIEFDRKDIPMNKVAVTTLEGGLSVFDVRTLSEEKGFASVQHKFADGTTIWTARHSPHNRDIFMTSSGSGTLNLWKYNYPSQRVYEDKDGKKHGVAGTLEELNHATVAEQPVASFAWCRDKQGLCAFTAFDQTVKIGIVTRLNQY